MTDPWLVQSTNDFIRQINKVNESKENTEHKILSNDTQNFGFEDSFIQDKNFDKPADSGNSAKEIVVETELQPLPDSEIYLRSLERKLENLKKNSKLVDALSEKRDDCLRSMLQNNSSITCNNDLLLELETSTANSDSVVQSFYRQIQPVQAVTVGETVHIVKYDQLEEQRLEAEANGVLEDNLSASR